MQLLLAAMVPLANEMELAPALGANVGDPHPDVEKVAGVATTIWLPDNVGSESLKLAPLKVPAFGFDTVKVSVDVPPATVDAGANALEMVRAVGSTTFA